MLATVKGALPVLLRVTVCGGLVVPTRWLPNAALAGESTAMGAVP